MPRNIKSGLIQMSLSKTEGEGTIQEIKEAMMGKHVPFIEDAGNRGFRFFAFRKYSIRPTSVRGRTVHGMHLQSLFRDQQWSACKGTRKNIIWS